MKILITGGTGFVGSHTVAELIRGGHDVTLLVRKRERVRPALDPLGVEVATVIEGDVTDPRSVEQATLGCDATIHCASIYSLDPRASKTIRETNVRGTEIVLGTAHRLGHDPIVHVSSFAALIGERGKVLTPDAPPTRPLGAYFRSKADSERVARRYQDSGAPVVITYPGSVWGPHDPHFGESCQMAINILRGLWILTPKGTVPITDVRDLARLHLAIMEKRRGPRRYMAPSINVSIREAMTTMASLTGRRLGTLSLPVWMLLWPLRALDLLQRRIPFRLPVNFQAAYCVGLSHPLDDSATRSEFGIAPRPLEETLGDTVRWLIQAGHLSPERAGRLAWDGANHPQGG
ncbi:MAG: NAD-dependent epimerase/dehydratase family protein [Chloroflexi bacterium]|nr:NAD-dependent epimerase/dehydratase family protein [Chloroflexota bacterium]